MQNITTRRARHLAQADRADTMNCWHRSDLKPDATYKVAGYEAKLWLAQTERPQVTLQLPSKMMLYYPLPLSEDADRHSGSDTVLSTACAIINADFRCFVGFKKSKD